MSQPNEGSEELAQITRRSFWLTEMKIFQWLQKLYCHVVFTEKQEPELASIKKLRAIAIKVSLSLPKQYMTVV